MNLLHVLKLHKLWYTLKVSTNVFFPSSVNFMQTLCILISPTRNKIEVIPDLPGGIRSAGISNQKTQFR